jgi:DNA topoisomerase-1
MPTPASPTEAKRRITVCVKAVSGVLGNTPTVCRSSYVHPRVFEMFESGALTALPRPDAASFEKALIKTLR